MSGDLCPAQWTLCELKFAQSASREGELVLLLKYGKSRLESDLARWTLLGRSYEEALSILNGQGAGGVMSVPRVAQ